MTETERYMKFHHESMVIDGLGGSAIPYDKLLAGGLTATNVTLDTQRGLASVMEDAKLYYALIEMVPDKVMLVEKVDDINKAKESGRLGIIFGLQDPLPLEENTRVLSTVLYILYKLGIRIMQLSYNDANALGCGCTEPNDTGLTSFGIQVVTVMNRLGIVVDLSHTGNRTSRDAAEVSDAPVIFSHANPLALKNTPRNKPDDLIQFVAKKGGVIGIMPYSSFCKSEYGEWPTLEDFLDQIDYAVQLVGIDHVGIGTDKFEGRTKLEYFSGIQTSYPKLMIPFEHRHVAEYSSISEWPRFTEGLLKRGYSEEDCSKIIGGNFFNLFKTVWKEMPFVNP